MRFPPSFLERLRTQLTLSEVIGRRIALKKHGREFQALCPFHNEKTPSFTVNDDKNFFHCFGCSAHGDAIGFIMRHDRLTYPEAVEHLAREAGIPLPELTREEAQRAEREKTQLGVLETACRWFEQRLNQHAPARQYAEKRGLNGDTVRRFRIGYAPEDRSALHQHLLKEGYPQAMQLEAGLIIQPDDGNVYDRFRGRLIFPIRSPRGDVVAFGGRLIAEAQGRPLAKYLNSPETTLFRKGEMLYNLDLAKRASRERERAVVLEGYMDVVSVAQAGVDYAVATLGTAVTPDHLKLLWQLCKEPVMCLDGDAAGKRAMARAAEIALPMLKPGCSLRFALLPKGEDPDSYVRKYGRASFEDVVGRAQPLYQTVWESLMAQYTPKLSLPEGRAALEAACKQLVGKIEDPTVRKHYDDFFKAQLWEKIRKAAPQGAAARSAQVERLASLDNPKTTQSNALVTRMLRLLMDFPSLLHKSAVEETLSHLDIKDQRLATLRDALLASLEQIGLEDRDALIAYLEIQLPQYNVRQFGNSGMLAGAALTVENAWQLWNEAVAAHQIAHLQAELATLQESIGQTIDEATHERMVELQQAIKKVQNTRTFAPMSTDAA